MRRSLALVCVLAIIFLPFLGEGKEVDQQAFAVTMALDNETGGQLCLSVQFRDASTRETGDATTGSPAGYQLVRVTAESYASCLDVLRATVPRELNFSQIRQVVINEDLARSAGFIDIISWVASTPSLRLSAPLVISAGKAYEFIAMQTPYLGLRISKYLETMMSSFEEEGYIPVVEVGTVARTIAAGYRDYAVTYGAVNNFENAETIGDVLPMDTLPGRLPRSATSRTEMLGAALFDDQRMVGTLTGLEMQILYFLYGELRNLSLVVDGVNYVFAQRVPTHLDVVQQDGEFALKVRGAVICYPVTWGVAEHAQLNECFTSLVIRVLQKLQAYGSDPAGFARAAVKHCATLQDWEALNFRSIYAHAKLDVSVEVSEIREP